MKRFFYLFVLLVVVILPVAGQKRQRNESWRVACKESCKQKYDACLRESQGDGPKKEQCERNYRGCINWCVNPPRQG